MDWIALTSSDILDEISAASFRTPVAIFKHSTRCSVSRMVLRAIEQDWQASVPAYFLDLLSYRDLSDRIASAYQVMHESPQLILIRDGKAIYHASHSEIEVSDMRKAIA